MNYSPTSLAATGATSIGLLQLSLTLFILGVALMAAASIIPRKDKS